LSEVSNRPSATKLAVVSTLPLKNKLPLKKVESSPKESIQEMINFLQNLQKEEKKNSGSNLKNILKKVKTPLNKKETGVKAEKEKEKNTETTLKDIYRRAEEQMLAENFYKSSSFYAQIGKEQQREKDGFFAQQKSDTYSHEFNSPEEAGKVIAKAGYSMMANGSLAGVNYQDRDKLSTWTKFNKHMVQFFQTIYGLGGDINYDRMI